MARYIDIDHLIFELNHKAMWQGRDAGFNTAIQITHAQPIADVVEVVRCKDCKHRRKTAHRSYCLPTFGLKEITDLNAYCSYGEKR